MTTTPTSQARFPWLEPLLFLLTLWATVEGVLAWWRQPLMPPTLPSRIQLDGRWYLRDPKLPAMPELPSGVVIRRGANYLSVDGQRLAMRWLVNESSGSGVRLEPEKLSSTLLGRGTQGFCRVYQPSTGVFLGTARTGSEVKSLLATTDPRGMERLQWLLGLRPWRQNRCLFVGKLP